MSFIFEKTLDITSQGHLTIDV